MKRFITLAIALLVCFLLVACGSNDETKDGEKVNSETVVDEVETSSDDNTTPEVEAEEGKDDIEADTSEADDSPELGTENDIKDEVVPEPEPVVNPSLTDTNTAKVESNVLSGDYYMVLNLSNKDADYNEVSSMKCTYAVKGEETYVRIVMNEPAMDFSMIMKPDVKYTLDNASKQYVEGIHDMLKSLADVAGRIKIGNLYNEDQNVEKGVVEIEGVEYEYEAFKEGESQISKYAFDKDGNLKYVIFTFDGFDTVVEIAELTSELPDGLFEIPDDYTEYVSVSEQA